MKRRTLLTLATVPALGACVNVGVGNEAGPQRQFILQDAGVGTQGRLPTLVPVLLVQVLPSAAAAETLAIAYSPRADELAYYQLATWADRPVKRIARLLVQRLEASALVGAASELGDPLTGDWLLTLRIDQLHHDNAAPPGRGQVALTAELFNRRQTGVRIARATFGASAPAVSADSAAAAAALSAALGSAFDQLLRWLAARLPTAG